MCKKLKTLLSIAGSDPTGGAGIQADIRAGNCLGVHVLTAITTLTAQNSKGVSMVFPIPHQKLELQLNAIIEEIRPDAIKIGILGNIENLKVTANFLKKFEKRIPVIIDPVLKATADNSVFSDNLSGLLDNYKKHLLPLASVITPNLNELNILTGNYYNKSNLSSEILKDLNVESLIITGVDFSNKLIKDVLVLKDQIYCISHKKINSDNLHGTGCVFSSLLASFQALGYNLFDAFKASNHLMNNLIKKSMGYSLGISNYGPLNINKYSI